MKRYSVILLLMLPTMLFAQDETESTLTEVGQIVPDFSVTTIEEKIIDIQKLRGEVVLLNFFATWCPPCMAEMPQLEKDIWQVFKESGLTVIAIGREHSAEELQKFNKEKGFTFHIAPDEKRDVYKLFASAYIPRNVLVDMKGKIVYQTVGFDKKDFDELKNKIAALVSARDEGN